MAFVGVCRRFTCTLCFHSFLMCLISAAVISAGILVLIYSREVIIKIQTSSTNIVKAMNTKNVSNIIMENLQFTIGCCGAEKPNDYSNPAVFCCAGSKNCTNYPKKGCNKVLGEFLSTYEVIIGVSLIVFGLFMAIPAYTAHRTKKNLEPAQRK
nr:tetraspanin [Hymenolepis microstoma]